MKTHMVKIIGPSGEIHQYKFTSNVQADSLYQYLLHIVDDQGRIHRNNNIIHKKDGDILKEIRELEKIIDRPDEQIMREILSDIK